jgi:predicted AAA+ superfamily ATPase
MAIPIHAVKAPAHDVVIHPYLPTHPAILAIVAPRKSGKTTLLVNLLTRKEMFKNFFHIIHIWSPTLLLDSKWQVVTKHLPDECLHMSFNDQEFLQLMNSFDDSEAKHNEKGPKKTKKPNVLFVFDDSASEKGLFSRNFTSPTVKAAFTGRHYNISMWIVSQSYKAISPGFRNNIFHWVIFDTPNEREGAKMAEELSGPLTSNQFLQLLSEVTREPYQFLYINFESANKQDIFRKGFGPPLSIAHSKALKNEKQVKNVVHWQDTAASETDDE